ncbi:hypothetical protein [Nocardioides sp. HB32]
MCELLLDVDVVMKLAAYDLLDVIAHPGCAPDCSGRRGVIATTRFVARKRLRRKTADTESAQARLAAFLGDAVELEPTDDELGLAADIEAEAAIAGLELDSGESQLCAIAIARSIPALLTGDKRAIAAAEALLETVAELAALTERIACLEQAMTLAVQRLGALPVRALVMAELGMDTAINICFQFTNPAVDETFEPSGLSSYINSVRASAPTLLIPGDMLELPSVA